MTREAGAHLLDHTLRVLDEAHRHVLHDLVEGALELRGTPPTGGMVGGEGFGRSGARRGRRERRRRGLLAGPRERRRHESGLGRLLEVEAGVDLQRARRKLVFVDEVGADLVARPEIAQVEGGARTLGLALAPLRDRRSPALPREPAPRAPRRRCRCRGRPEGLRAARRLRAGAACGAGAGRAAGCGRGAACGAGAGRAAGCGRGAACGASASASSPALAACADSPFRRCTSCSMRRRWAAASFSPRSRCRSASSRSASTLSGKRLSTASN